jgi:hypothetical protein
MPIEIRPSDVVLGAGQALSQWAQVAEDIFKTEYEKERVKEVNNGLILSEMARQKDLESYQDPKKVIEVQPAYTTPGESPIASMPSQYKALGDVTQGVVENELRKQQAALEEQIRLTTPNKRAREELITRSKMAAIDHRNKVMGEWRQASQSVYLHGLKDYATLLTMDQTTPLENTIDPVTGVKTVGLIERMEDRLAEGIGAGWVTRDAADTYLVQFEDQLQYSRALNGALDLSLQTEMVVGKKTVTPEITPQEEGVQTEETMGRAKEAGKPFDVTTTRRISPEEAVKNAEDYLASIPYYRNKPEERDKIFDVVLRKYTAMTKANDEAVDSKYAMLHLQAVTVEDIDIALGELEREKIYDGLVRFRWDQAFRSMKDKMLSGAGAKDVPVTQEGIDALNEAYFSDRTTKEYLDRLVYLKDRDVISPEVAREWFKKDAERAGRQNTYKVMGAEAINKSFEAALSKVRLGTDDKSRAKYTQLLIDQMAALDKFTRTVAGMTEGQGKEILAAAGTYAMIELPEQVPINDRDIDFTKKGKILDLMLAIKKQQPAIYLTSESTGKLAAATSTMLIDTFGAKNPEYLGDTKWYGVPMVIVKGMEPGRPNDEFYYYLDTDENDELQMYRWNGVDDPKPTMAPTLATTRVAAVRAAVAAADKAGLAGVEATNFIEKAVGGAPLSGEELRLTPSGKLPGEVEITTAQLSKFYSWVRGKKSFTTAEIEAFSKTSGITMTKLREVLRNRGLEVKP